MRSAGIDVSVGGRGFTVRVVLSSMRSSVVRSSPLTGSVPCSAMYDSMRRFSNTFPAAVLVAAHGEECRESCIPLLREATGTCGCSPDTIILLALSFSRAKGVYLTCAKHVDVVDGKIASRIALELRPHLQTFTFANF